MASPPFTIDPTQPTDIGIVSQYPLNERTNRDNIKSWLTVDHNTSGQHNHVTFPQAALPGAPGAGLTWLYAFTDGTLHVASGAAGTDEVLIPPSVVVPCAAGAVPNGWLYCNGQAVSRTTFARLFGLLGTQYGIGDGSTTFNVPDLRNRTVFGVDGAGMGGAANSSRITAGFVSPDGNTYGATGGLQSITITQASLPAVNFVGTCAASGSSTTNPAVTSIAIVSAVTGFSINNIVGLFGGGATGFTSGGSGAANANPSDPGHTHTVSDPAHSHSFSVSVSGSASVSSGGSGTQLQNLPPCLLMAWIIKW